MSSVNQNNDRLKKAKTFADVLFSVLFFNIFSLDELYEIVLEDRLIKWKKFEKNQKIFREGDFDQHFYIVIQGRVNIASRGINPFGDENPVASIHKGEVFGELVVCDPDQPRRASAYAAKEGAVVCEVDATLLGSVSGLIKVKFLKKFLDLIVERMPISEQVFGYYKEIIGFAQKNGSVGEDEFFSYSVETSINEKNRLTQYIKYTDFLISKKTGPEQIAPHLQQLLQRAVQDLDKNLNST